MGGNGRWEEFVERRMTRAVTVTVGVDDDERLMERWREMDERLKEGGVDRKELGEWIRVKYESEVAREYRELLDSSVDATTSTATTTTTTWSKPQTTMSSKASSIILSEEQPPSVQDVYNTQAWPFALALLKRNRKSRLFLFAWSLCGLGGVYWVQLLSRDSTATATTARGGFIYYNLLAVGVVVLTAGIPYYLLSQMAWSIARNLVNNRLDAFKSARNLLIQRIGTGRATRLKSCDVYYPTVDDDEKVAKRGLVFYPGALVDRTAYATIACKLSDAGILVAVANLEPYRLVMNLQSYNCKERVMRVISDALFLGDSGGVWQVEEWALGGHSMGGHVAIAAVANEMSSTVKKVVLWGVASYPDPSTFPCRALREVSGVNVLVVNGSNDEITKSTKFGKDKVAVFEAKMPPRGTIRTSNSFSSDITQQQAPIDNRQEQGCTHYVTIEGGNHSGCAHYPDQTFPLVDGNRSITLEEQQDQTTKVTVDFLVGTLG
eukprot:g13250.t1 g13250   contig8:256192-257746(+)